MTADTALTAAEYHNKKIGMLSEMLQIAKSQMDSIMQDQPAELLQALRKRECIMRRIDNLDAMFQTSDPAGYRGDNAEIEGIAATILDIDRQCSERAGQRMAVYKADLKSIAQSAKQLGAYASPYASSQGIYFDTRK